MDSRAATDVRQQFGSIVKCRPVGEVLSYFVGREIEFGIQDGLDLGAVNVTTGVVVTAA